MKISLEVRVVKSTIVDNTSVFPDNCIGDLGVVSSVIAFNIFQKSVET